MSSYTGETHGSPTIMHCDLAHCHHHRHHRLCPPQIAKSLAGQRRGRLYLTDGSMPDYGATGYPRDAPGQSVVRHLRPARRLASGLALPLSARAVDCQCDPLAPEMHIYSHAPITTPPHILVSPHTTRRHALPRGRPGQRDAAPRRALQPRHQPLPRAQGTHARPACCRRRF